MTWFLELCYPTTIGFSIVFLIVHDSNDTLDTTSGFFRTWQVIRCMGWWVTGSCKDDVGPGVCVSGRKIYDNWKACSYPWWFLGENRPHNGQNKSGLEMFGIYVVFVQMFFTQHPLLAIQTGPKAVKWHHALHSLVRLQMSCCFIIHLPYIIFFSALFALCHGVVVPHVVTFRNGI